MNTSRILIAEDQDRIAAFVARGLEKQGFGVAIAPDGRQAFLMAQSNQFDLLLLDLGLPIEDGWTVLCKLRSQGNPIAIIIVTARDENEEKKKAEERGANGYLKKPFRFQDLLTDVHRLISHSD